MIGSPIPSLPEQHESARSRWERWRTDLLAGKGWVSILPILVMGALLIVGSSKDFFAHSTDVSKYRCYAFTFWHGGLYPGDPSCNFIATWANAAPFHTLPREYPILALLPFSLTLLTPPDWFQVGFAVWLMLFAAGIYLYLGRVGPRGASLTFALYLVLGGWATAASRFDLFPAAVTLFCLVAATRGRFRLAYLLLGIATMLKLYPAPLLLPLFLAEQRAQPGPLWRWKRLEGVGIFAGACAGLFLLSLLLSPEGAASVLGYFAGRPIQIESVPASIMWLASLLGWPICTAYQFGSLNSYDRILGGCTATAGPPAGPLTTILSMLSLVLLLAGVVAVAWMQWRGNLTLPQAFVALLLVIILTGKVFSPQYFIWLAPLIAYVIGFDWAWVICWCIISALTTVIYPYLYGPAELISQAPSGPAFYPTIALRNLLLVLAVVAYLFDAGHLRSRAARKAAAALEPGEPVQEASLAEQRP